MVTRIDFYKNLAFLFRVDNFLKANKTRFKKTIF